MRTARRIAVSLIALVVVVAVVVAVVGVGLVRRSFPTTSGTLDVRGLSAPVDVLRDKQGVPQIYADNAQDLFRAQGGRLVSLLTYYRSAEENVREVYIRVKGLSPEAVADIKADLARRFDLIYVIEEKAAGA